MFLAAATLDARERLKGHKVRHVLAGVEAEILVTYQRRDLAELVALHKDRNRTQYEVQVLVCGISGRKINRQAVCSHQTKGLAPCGCWT